MQGVLGVSGERVALPPTRVMHRRLPVQRKQGGEVAFHFGDQFASLSQTEQGLSLRQP